MHDAPERLKQELAALLIGPPQVHANLAFFPLTGRARATTPYIVLAEALATADFTITEIGDAGSVPELAVGNALDSAVLMLDGDELAGAKQNRVLNVTVLVPPKAKVIVPVSCVEQGRWHYASRRFRSAGETLYARARADKARDVNTSMKRGGQRRSDQSALWSSIADKQSRMGAMSDTGAMDSLYREHRTQLSDFDAAFSAGPEDRGGIFAVNGRIVGMDLFDSAATFAHHLPRLIRSHALDAVDSEQTTSETPSIEHVGGFLKAVAAAPTREYAAVGMGTEVRFDSERLAGGALMTDEAMIHLCAFEISR